ncbi:hypothetical protein PVAP13_6NG105703 [Panicum virgatum]|uniref:Uncharacterized protein n=1 Tax=Panicum virgatum TaxID=38727 RepID=A0A8T0QW69_PANVG|nr:hypothetical protein PVAP13_6NG105703 [Panicum virgatum]
MDQESIYKEVASAPSSVDLHRPSLPRRQPSSSANSSSSAIVDNWRSRRRRARARVHARRTEAGGGSGKVTPVPRRRQPRPCRLHLPHPRLHQAAGGPHPLIFLTLAIHHRQGAGSRQLPRRRGYWWPFSAGVPLHQARGEGAGERPASVICYQADRQDSINAKGKGSGVVPPAHGRRSPAHHQQPLRLAR